jgi:transposase
VTTSSSASSVSIVNEVFAGIDVSKDKLDVARHDQAEVHTFANSGAGVTRLVKLLTSWSPKRIAIESTGRLHRLALDAMLDASLNACLVNPTRVHHFAKSRGQLAKTDAIDALLLALFAQQNDLWITQKLSEKQVELAELVNCRQQHVQSRVAHANQMDQTQSKFARKKLATLIELLNDQIEELDEQIARLIDEDQDMQGKNQILKSVAGVGPVLASTLLSSLPELGQRSHKEIAALVGVAPYNHDSGKHRGERRIRGGRMNVRNVLYVCTVAALRCNPVIKKKYKELVARGKARKSALIACSHKLLRILNALLRDGQKYQPTAE